jgi:hypothetical protein
MVSASANGSSIHKCNRHPSCGGDHQVRPFAFANGFCIHKWGWGIRKRVLHSPMVVAFANWEGVREWGWLLRPDLGRGKPQKRRERSRWLPARRARTCETARKDPPWPDLAQNFPSENATGSLSVPGLNITP